MTTSCAAATLALGPELFGSASVLSSKDVAVGFLRLDDFTTSSDRLKGLVAASAVPSTDGSFISRGARVSLAGFGFGSASRRTIVIQPHFLADGSQDIAFDAWRFTRSTSASGGRVTFAMPVDTEQRLRFTFMTAQRNAPIVRDNATAEKVDESSVTFSLMNEAGVVPLTRGYYAVVPLLDGAAEPRWSAMTLKAKDGLVMLHEMKNGSLQPIDREHFVFKFDYTKA